MASNDIVTITSSDGDSFEIEVDKVKLSKTICSLIEDAGIGNPIPLPNVNTRTLEKIIEYLEYHSEHPNEHLDYEKKDDLEDVGEWDRAFCDNIKNNSLLFEVIMGSNFMDIQPLLHLTCKHVARKIKGKNPDEIKEALKCEESTSASDSDKGKEEEC